MAPSDDEPVPVSGAVDFGLARLLPDLDRPRAWLLTVDGAPQSYVDLDDPGHLEFEYARRIAYVVGSAFDGPVRAVHLGGGGMTLPRWLAWTRPGSVQDVVEADRALAALVAAHLPLPGATAADTADAAETATVRRPVSDAVPFHEPVADGTTVADDPVSGAVAAGAGDPSARTARSGALPEGHGPARAGTVTVHTADARAWLAGCPAGSVDLVVADVFGGSRVSAHLTSVEFVRAAVRVLRPGGVYVANLADAAPFAFLGSQLATVREAFGGFTADGACLLAEPGVLRGRRFGNAVLAVSRRPLPLAALARACAGDAFPARVVHGRGLAAMAGEPVHDRTATPSPEPPEGAFTVG